MPPLLDLHGKTFGRLNVVGPHQRRSGVTYWRCECSCGLEVWVSVGHLRSGNTKSCGCLNEEQRRERKTTHGCSQTRLYKTWKRMRVRCNNPWRPCDMNRREFIKGAASAAVLAAVGMPALAAGGFDKEFNFIRGPEPVGRNIYAFHFPHFCHLHDDGYWLWAYFIDHSQGSHNDVGLARSKDGLHFDYYGKVLTKGDYFDDAQASFPDVAIGPDGLLHMLYEGKRADGDVNTVCHATSHNGVDWVKQGPIIIPDNWQARKHYGNLPTPGQFARVDVGTPTLVWDGEYHVYFHGFSGSRVQIGYAHGSSLDSLECLESPIIRNGDLDSGTCGSRTNIINGTDGFRYMAFEISTHEKWGPQRFEHCWWGGTVARAKDYAGPWQKLNGVLLPRNGTGPGGLNRGMAYEPNVLLQDGERTYLYYRNPAGSTNRVGVRGF